MITYTTVIQATACNREVDNPEYVFESRLGEALFGVLFAYCTSVAGPASGSAQSFDGFDPSLHDVGMRLPVGSKLEMMASSTCPTVGTKR